MACLVVADFSLETFTVANLKMIFPVFLDKARTLSSYFETHLDNNGKGVIDGEQTTEVVHLLHPTDGRPNPR